MGLPIGYLPARPEFAQDFLLIFPGNSSQAHLLVISLRGC